MDRVPGGVAEALTPAGGVAAATEPVLEGTASVGDPSLLDVQFITYNL
jgi:hypothetical protein